MDLSEYVEPTIAFIRANQVWPFDRFALAFGESVAFLSWFSRRRFSWSRSEVCSAQRHQFLAVWLAAGIAAHWATPCPTGSDFSSGLDPQLWPIHPLPGDDPEGPAVFDRWRVWRFPRSLLGPIRAVIPVVAGMYAMRQVPFQIANVSSAFLWATGVLAPSTFGAKWLIGAA